MFYPLYFFFSPITHRLQHPATSTAPSTAILSIAVLSRVHFFFLIPPYSTTATAALHGQMFGGRHDEYSCRRALLGPCGSAASASLVIGRHFFVLEEKKSKKKKFHEKNENKKSFVFLLLATNFLLFCVRFFFPPFFPESNIFRMLPVVSLLGSSCAPPRATPLQLCVPAYIENLLLLFLRIRIVFMI